MNQFFEAGKTDSFVINIPEGKIMEETILQLFKLDKIAELYTEEHVKDPIVIINSLIDLIDLKFEIPAEDLKNIPEKGPFITVSNHPFR